MESSNSQHKKSIVVYKHIIKLTYEISNLLTLRVNVNQGITCKLRI